MASTVEICNLALGWLGVNPIISLGDDTVEASLCNVNYPLLRDAVLEARAWTFASKRTTLAPTVGGIPDTDNFGFANRFTLPGACIRVIYAGSTPNFYDRLYWVKEGNEILANAGKLYVLYTIRVTDPEQFSSAFTQALAARLAADLCIALTENRSLQADLWKIYEIKLIDAAGTDGMQGRQQPLRSDALVIPRIVGANSLAGPYV